MTHTSKEQPELLPCPFCGGNDLAIENQVVHPDNYHSAFVRCNTCEMDGPSSLSLPEPDGCWMLDAESAQEKAGKAWNRRDQAPQAQRKPLTDKKIRSAAKKIDEGSWANLVHKNCWHSGFYEGAREAERAHGIKD